MIQLEAQRNTQAKLLIQLSLLGGIFEAFFLVKKTVSRALVHTAKQSWDK